MLRAVVMLLVLAAPALPAWGEDVGGVRFVPGTTVGMQPPEGWQPATGFSGFVDEAGGGSVVIVELPKEAFAEIAPDADVERLRKLLAPSGVAVETAGQRTVGGRPAVLVRGSQSARGVGYRKWIAIVDAGQTIVITVQAPAANAPTDAAVDGMLGSVVFRAEPAIADQIAELPFEIGETGPFRPVRVLAGSNLLLTAGPADVVHAMEQPLMVIGASLGDIPAVADRLAYARERLARYPTFRLREIIGGGSPAPGGDTVELVAAVDHESGVEGRIIQWMRFDGGGYLLVVGMARADGWEAILPAIRKVNEGVRAKR